MINLWLATCSMLMRPIFSHKDLFILSIIICPNSPSKVHEGSRAAYPFPWWISSAHPVVFPGVPRPAGRCNPSSVSWVSSGPTHSWAFPEHWAPSGSKRDPHPIPVSDPGFPAEKSHLDHFYPQPYSLLRHYSPELMTVDEDTGI